MRAAGRDDAPRAAPTSCCAAMASESSTVDMNTQSCRTTWCAATDAGPNRAVTAVADRKQAWKARLRRSRSRPRPSWARRSAGTGRSGTRSPVASRTRAATKSSSTTDCAPTLAIAEPSRPRPDHAPRPWTRNGHASAEAPLPASTTTTGARVDCTPRIQPFPAIATRIPGAPHSAIRIQETAPSASGPPPESTSATGRAANCPTTTTARPASRASQVAAPPAELARSARRERQDADRPGVEVGAHRGPAPPPRRRGETVTGCKQRRGACIPRLAEGSPRRAVERVRGVLELVLEILEVVVLPRLAVGVGLPGVGGPGGLRGDLLVRPTGAGEELLHPCGALGDGVEHELERRGVPHPGLAADGGPDDALGALQGDAARLPGVVVAVDGVEDRRLPQVRGEPGVGDGDHRQARVLHLVLERRGDDLDDPLGEPSGPRGVGHLGLPPGSVT